MKLPQLSLKHLEALRRIGFPLALASLLAALLVPACWAFGDLGLLDQRLPAVAATLAVLALLALLPGLVGATAAALVASGVVLLMLVVRFAYFGLVQFSGAGFTSEVFIHLEPESFEVAWEQYRALMLLGLAILVAVALLVGILARRVRAVPLRVGVLVAALACVGLVLTHRALPEWMLAQAASEWYGPKRLDLPLAELQAWRNSGLVQVDLRSKDKVVARAAAPPRNLILVYLESVGLSLIDPPRYPGLMPNLARRVARQSLASNYHTSGFITIEGIVNSQCGTLFPFEGGSDALAGFDGVAEAKACLADVLASAGYVQSYLGGAETSFAGKGNFLAAHGYDTVKGMAEWREAGLSPRPGGWGLGDPDLFTQATAELERLRASGRPFNLTVLTIGTHLPGFTYAECTPYGSDERFVESLHCTDQLLERWLGEIGSAGYLVDTVVVITGDHPPFPNPEMKRLFGKAAIQDKRLPLVVLGATDVALPTAAEGASFDLAPTVLDLLGVAHDARFALGRSLLQPASRSAYFPTRYADVWNGDYIVPAAGDCESGSPQPPLDRCGKDALMTLLRMQNLAFSAPAARLDCSHPAKVRVRVPAAADAPLQFLVAGEDQAPRFTFKARTGRAGQPGLFAAGFSAAGELVERRFVPASDGEQLAAPPPASTGQTWLLAWRGAQDAAAPPWLDPVAAADGRAVATLDADGQLTPLTATHATEDGTEYALDATACAALLP